MHRGRQEDAHIRVQNADAAASKRNATAVVSQRQRQLLDQLRALRFRLPARRTGFADRNDELLAQTLAEFRSTQFVRRRLK